MKKFESLDSRKVSLVEESIRAKYLKDNILDKCVENRNDAPIGYFMMAPLLLMACLDFITWLLNF